MTENIKKLLKKNTATFNASGNGEKSRRFAMRREDKLKLQLPRTAKH